MCVSGYLFSSEQATRLDKEFAEALAECGVNTFHSVDSAQGTNEFRDIGIDKRLTLLKHLISSIKRRAEFGVSVSASETDFGRRVAPGNWKPNAGPYPICVAQAVSCIVGWCEKYNYNGKVSYFFEQGHRHSGVTNSVIDEIRSSPLGKSGMRYASHTFADRRSVRPLQAADILAYEWTRELIRTNDPKRQPPIRPMRTSLEILLELSHKQQHLGTDEFEAFARGGLKSILEHMRHFHPV